jgi:hypothetical protein
VRVGTPGLLPRAPTTDAALVRGFNGRRNWWTFMFESAWTLWALQDTGRYNATGTGGAAAFSGAMAAVNPTVVTSDAIATAGGVAPTSVRPVFTRVTVSSSLTKWAWSAATQVWNEVPGARVAFPAGQGVYSLAGRYEPGAVGFVLYAASRGRVYRVAPEMSVVPTVVASAPAGQLFRGVALPPYPSPTPSASPRPPTPTPTRSVPAATPSPSRTRSPKAKRLA